ncbi:hypothetical protein [Teredinibacter turnerae]|uniref:DUF5666 domain-containing protein n=1 Tax=Teredinibacter turnerae (strain ATCC 39867 / T7901) TaxID=377629 RepID=C5BML0_TERTT|nr:hypothetical protein [Teredinibacter turnerae]ACR13813.1 hypothetical protein TERTU_2763 [Teredinibacter turnerae T7901]
MLKKSVAASALFLSLAAPFAGAYSLVDSEVVKGTIETVDASTNTLVLEKANGRETRVGLSEKANFYINGNAIDINDLKAGHEVRINRKTFTKVEDKLVGEIVAVNRKDKTAKLRLSNKETVNVQFGDQVAVSGVKSVSSFDQLRPGHQVVISYAK